MSNTAVVYPNNVQADASGNVTVTGGETLAGALTQTNVQPKLNATAATTYLETFQNNGTDTAYIDKGGMHVPALVNPSTYYTVDDFDGSFATTDFVQNGNLGFGLNSITAPLVTANNVGILYCHTSSTTAGGYITTFGNQIVKSTTINYRWRMIFYAPAVSSPTNRYTLCVGAIVATGTANNANAGPFAGPYLTYSDNLNSANWVMGSAVNGTRTTGTTSTAYASGWHTLQIDLANGTYTFTLDSVNIGTLADSNILTTVANNQSASRGGIQIVPDGTNFTTNRVTMIDRADFWVTGLSR